MLPVAADIRKQQASWNYTNFVELYKTNGLRA